MKITENKTPTINQFQPHTIKKKHVKTNFNFWRKTPTYVVEFAFQNKYSDTNNELPSSMSSRSNEYNINRPLTSQKLAEEPELADITQSSDETNHSFDGKSLSDSLQSDTGTIRNDSISSTSTAETVCSYEVKESRAGRKAETLTKDIEKEKEDIAKEVDLPDELQPKVLFDATKNGSATWTFNTKKRRKIKNVVIDRKNNKFKFYKPNQNVKNHLNKFCKQAKNRPRVHQKKLYSNSISKIVSKPEVKHVFAKENLIENLDSVLTMQELNPDCIEPHTIVSMPSTCHKNPFKSYDQPLKNSISTLIDNRCIDAENSKLNSFIFQAKPINVSVAQVNNTAPLLSNLNAANYLYKESTSPEKVAQSMLLTSKSPSFASFNLKNNVKQDLSQPNNISDASDNTLVNKTLSDNFNEAHVMSTSHYTFKSTKSQCSNCDVGISADTPKKNDVLIEFTPLNTAQDIKNENSSFYDYKSITNSQDSLNLYTKHFGHGISKKTDEEVLERIVRDIPLTMINDNNHRTSDTKKESMTSSDTNINSSISELWDKLTGALETAVRSIECNLSMKIINELKQSLSAFEQNKTISKITLVDRPESPILPEKYNTVSSADVTVIEIDDIKFRFDDTKINLDDTRINLYDTRLKTDDVKVEQNGVQCDLIQTQQIDSLVLQRASTAARPIKLMSNFDDYPRKPEREVKVDVVRKEYPMIQVEVEQMKEDKVTVSTDMSDQSVRLTLLDQLLIFFMVPWILLRRNIFIFLSAAGLFACFAFLYMFLTWIGKDF